jgi:hypothetical protein
MRLEALLKSNKPLEVYSIKEEDVRAFAHEARRFGVTYAALKAKGDSPDGMIDFMVKAEDASKLNRIKERLDYAANSPADLKAEVLRSREATEQTPEPKDTGEQSKTRSDVIVDAMLDKETAPTPTPTPTTANPPKARIEAQPLHPSAPGLEVSGAYKAKAADKDGLDEAERRPSVRKELERMKSERAGDTKALVKQPQKQIQHIQPTLPRRKVPGKEER